MPDANHTTRRRAPALPGTTLNDLRELTFDKSPTRGDGRLGPYWSRTWYVDGEACGELHTVKRGRRSYEILIYRAGRLEHVFSSRESLAAAAGALASFLDGDEIRGLESSARYRIRRYGSITSAEPFAVVDEHDRLASGPNRGAARALFCGTFDSCVDWLRDPPSWLADA